jgi:hypothetical protein
VRRHFAGVFCRNVLLCTQSCVWVITNTNGVENERTQQSAGNKCTSCDEQNIGVLQWWASFCSPPP